MSLIQKMGSIFTPTKQTVATKNLRGFSGLADGMINALAGYSYVAIQKIATTTAQLTTYVVDEDGEVVEQSWLSDLLKYPNKSIRMAQYPFIEQVVMWLLYKGNAYIYTKPEGRGNIPLKLELIPSNLVEPVVHGGALAVSHYKVQGMGVIQPEHMCHIKTLLPGSNYSSSLLIGQPRVINAVAGAMMADQFMLEYINAYFQRQAFPPLILETDSNLDDETWESIKARFNQAVPGNKLLVLLEGGLKANPLNLGAKEIDFIIKNSLSEEVIKRIAAAFQVPYSVIMSEYQNKDTSKTNIEEFHTSAIEPMMKNIEESLTLHLQELTGTTERITHDRYEWVDPTQKLEREKFYYEIGVLDADYFVNMEGFKKLAPNSNVNNANSQLKLKSDITNLKRTLYWQQKDATNTRFTDTMQSKLQTVVKELEKQVIESVKATKGKGEKGLRMPTDIFDINKLMELTIGLLGDVWDKFLVGRLRSAEADIDVTPDPLSAYEQYIKDTTRTTTDLIKESYLNMGDEIKDAIQRTVELNPYATDDELIDLVEDSIKNKTGQLSKARTRTIARTTATAMNGSAQHRVYSKFGASTVWISRRDNDTRDDHRDADGKSPDAEGYFKVGTDRMKYPGGGSSAKQNVNCRCILGAGLAVVSDDDV